MSWMTLFASFIFHTLKAFASLFFRFPDRVFHVAELVRSRNHFETTYHTILSIIDASFHIDHATIVPAAFLNQPDCGLVLLSVSVIMSSKVCRKWKSLLSFASSGLNSAICHLRLSANFLYIFLLLEAMSSSADLLS
jgi:hypothetical protein